MSCGARGAKQTGVLNPRNKGERKLLIEGAVFVQILRECS